jgi:hypothetical protein
VRDLQVEIPLPNEHSRLDILKIHASKITKHGEIGTMSPHLHPQLWPSLHVFLNATDPYSCDGASCWPISFTSHSSHLLINRFSIAVTVMRLPVAFSLCCILRCRLRGGGEAFRRIQWRGSPQRLH